MSCPGPGPQVQLSTTENIHGPIVPTSLSRAVVILCAVGIPLSTVTVGFRIFAQRYAKHGMAPDDYAVAAALAVIVAMLAFGIWGALMAGVGWPLEYFALGGIPLLERFGVFIFAAQIVWGLALVLIRTGLLLFYRRIFNSQTCQRVIVAFLVFNTTWFCTLTIGMFARYRWNTSVHCDAGYVIWLLVHCALDIVLDVSTVCIPLFVVGSLNMQRRNKILVSGLFALGFFCVIASCIRLKYMVDVVRGRSDQLQDYLDAICNVCIWGAIHPVVALFTACLPAYVPAFQRNETLNKLLKKAVSVVPMKEKNESQENFARMRCESQISKTITWSVIRHASNEDFPEHLARHQSEIVAPFA